MSLYYASGNTFHKHHDLSRNWLIYAERRALRGLWQQNKKTVTAKVTSVLNTNLAKTIGTKTEERTP